MPLGLRAQALPPLQPEQDCINALPVCQNIYNQPNSYTGQGAIPNEITPAISCLASGERNDVWYIFTVQSSGLLNFTITPNVLSNDYDWAVYNLTNASCSDIATNASLQVSCNFSGTSGNTGPSQPGAPSSQGAGGTPFNAPIPVTVGETYVINISNFSSSNNGYTLNFSASTAVIFDNIPPEMTTLTPACNGSGLDIAFSENVVCASVQASDFTLTTLGGTPVPLTGVSGANCAVGGSFENNFSLSTSALLTPGIYLLSLTGIVVDNCGNVALPTTDTLTITSAFQVTATADTVCPGTSVVLTATTLSGYTYQWNPVASTNTSIAVTPAATTTYTATATAVNGCVVSASKTITVIPFPQALIAPAAAQVCEGLLLAVDFGGTALAGATYAWDFGGGTATGSGPGPYQVAWSTPGSITLSLIVDQYGCADTSTTQVQVLPQPGSDFTAPAQVCMTLPATIQYAGSSPASASYLWDFDGGIVLSGNGLGPYQVEWATPGGRQVCLFVEESGCLSTPTCKPVQVRALPIVEIADPADQCLKGNQFSFAYSGPSAAATYLWSLGEAGATSTQAAPVYSYATPGIKTVSLLLSDVNGCVSTGAIDIEVLPSPVAGFAFTPVCEGLATPFQDQTQLAAPATLIAWNWTLGDGSSQDTLVFAHSYPGYGTYPVRLEVVSSDGCRDTIERQVEVYEQPAAAFTFDPSCDEAPVVFANTTRLNFPSVSYAWDFGDGQGSSDSDPSHVYGSYGIYTVLMTATSGQGCSDVAEAKVEVYPLPTAGFTTDPVCLDDQTTFVNTSSVPLPGELTRYRWDFGDGRSSTLVEPALYYRQPGRYTVSLRAETRTGCADSISQVIDVYPRPLVNFDATAACALDSARFVNRSSIVDTVTGNYIQSWDWDFGDGQGTGSLDAPAHLYRTAGSYAVTLRVVSDKGCETSRTRTVEAYALPDAPAVVGDTVCFGYNAFLLAPQSPPTVVEWYEALGDDTPFQTSYSYATPPVVFGQTYYVEALSNRGCRSVRVPVSASLFEDLDTEMLLSDTVVSLPVALVNFGVEGNFAPATYSWNFGDGQTGTSPAPAHSYAYPGRYAVQVELTSAQGCVLTLERSLEVRLVSEVFVPSAFTPNDDGQNDVFTIGQQLFSDLRFLVVNRWGQVVFEAEGPGFAWNGRLPSGGAAPAGVYTYQLQGTDYLGRRVQQAGTITLIR
ncbi:MAG: hypothetical protein OHK0039_20000 [Bacteroidia bacterium]